MSDTLCPRCTPADARQLRRATLRLCPRHQQEQAGAERHARRVLRDALKTNPRLHTRARVERLAEREEW